MPNRVKTTGALAAALALASLGCNATCIRDTDCLGDSICSDNRCLLVVRRDAGTAPDSRVDSSDRDDASTASQPDAGN